MSLAEQLGISEQAATQAVGDYLNTHIIAIFSYALYSMIFASTLHQIVLRNTWPAARVTLTIIVCLIVWALATIDAGLSWSVLYEAYVTHGQTQDTAMNTKDFAQAAAPTLIIGRVVSGEARPNDTGREPSLLQPGRSAIPTIHFASREPTTIHTLDILEVSSEQGRTTTLLREQQDAKMGEDITVMVRFPNDSTDLERGGSTNCTG
ncbi:hypothetical protein BDZ89DRAFT_1161260 [Hymenopellis radicata]|nr:hypothetical protein BDZ89DRAFT_1161260 [Hymenopellis radicata]